MLAYSHTKNVPLHGFYDGKKLESVWCDRCYQIYEVIRKRYLTEERLSVKSAENENNE